MTTQTLSAALVISAKDQNLARLVDAVSSKIDKLASAGKRIDGLGGQFNRLGNEVDHASRRLDGLHTRMSRINTVGLRMKTTMAQAASAIATTGAVVGLGHATVKATAEGAHERVRMETAGMTPAEIKESEDVSGRLTGEYTSVSQTTILHLLRNARSIVGSFEEAAHIIDPLLKTFVVAQGAHPEHQAELAADFDKLVKGMEIKGVTQDLPKFERYLDGMSKALNAFGDTLRPTDYYEMFKYGRQATQSLNEKFMLMTAPTLAQELGGSGAGKALSSFFQAIVGGKLKPVAANELLKYDLLDRRKIKISKAGIVTHVDPGAVKGAALAAADPYAWVNEVFLPALKKKGVTDPNRIQEIIAIMFQQATAAQLTSIFATQQSRIEKDWSIVAGAKGSEAAKIFLAKDPFVAWHSVTEQFNNLLQAAGSPLALPAAQGLNAIAQGLNALTKAAVEHPSAGSAATAVVGTAAASGAAVAAGHVLGWSWLKTLGMGGLRWLPGVGGAAWAASLIPEIEKQRPGGAAASWEWTAGLHKDDWRRAEAGQWGNERLPVYHDAAVPVTTRPVSVGGRIDIHFDTDLFTATVRSIVHDEKGEHRGSTGDLGDSMTEARE